MLSKEERNLRNITIKSEHFPIMCWERKHLFPFKYSLKEMWNEIKESIKDPQTSVIIEDKREESESSHLCIFIGQSSKLIAIPCIINEDKIMLTTIKDIEKDYKPKWYMDKYNEIASQRGMTLAKTIYYKLH